MLFKYEKELGIKEKDLFWETDQMLDDDRQEYWKEQRELYGFDEREVWSLYSRIAVFIYPRLKMYRDFCSSSIPFGMTQEKWEGILDDMLFAFAYISKDKLCGTIEEKKRVKKGLKSFRKYFFDLWN